MIKVRVSQRAGKVVKQSRNTCAHDIYAGVNAAKDPSQRHANAHNEKGAAPEQTTCPESDDTTSPRGERKRNKLASVPRRHGTGAREQRGQRGADAHQGETTQTIAPCNAKGKGGKPRRRIAAPEGRGQPNAVI